MAPIHADIVAQGRLESSWTPSRCPPIAIQPGHHPHHPHPRVASGGALLGIPSRASARCAPIPWIDAGGSGSSRAPEGPARGRRTSGSRQPCHAFAAGSRSNASTGRARPIGHAHATRESGHGPAHRLKPDRCACAT